MYTVRTCDFVYVVICLIGAAQYCYGLFESIANLVENCIVGECFGTNRNSTINVDSFVASVDPTDIASESFFCPILIFMTNQKFTTCSFYQVDPTLLSSLKAVFSCSGVIFDIIFFNFPL